VSLSKGGRFRILKRDGFRCVYCGRKPPEIQLHVDHATSRKNGGSDEDENLVAACVDCNLGKSAGNAQPGTAPEAPPPAPPETADSILVGKFLHVLGEGRRIDRQGVVKAVKGDLAAVQWFSFLTGSPTTITPMRVDDLLVPEFDPASRVRLYDSEKEWKRAYMKEASDNFRQGLWRNEQEWSDDFDKGGMAQVGL
jgi:hypothetical protein